MTIAHRFQLSSVWSRRCGSADLESVSEHVTPPHRNSPKLFDEEQDDKIRQYELLLSRYRTELEKVTEQMHALVERAVVPLSCEPTLSRMFGSEEAQGI
jgi:hypothetical protein